MKPVTHPLAIALLDEIEASTTNARLSDRAFRARVAWSRAGYPRYADPTPMPAPALGMRVWVSAPDIGGGTKCRNYDIHSVSGRPVAWENCINENDTIDLITDYRKGDAVLWERK